MRPGHIRLNRVFVFICTTFYDILKKNLPERINCATFAYENNHIYCS